MFFSAWTWWSPMMCQNQSDLPSVSEFAGVQLEGCAWLRLAWVTELESTDQIWTCFITFPQCSTSVRSQSFTRTNKYFGSYSHILSYISFTWNPVATTYKIENYSLGYKGLNLCDNIVLWYESTKKLNEANIFPWLLSMTHTFSIQVWYILDHILQK